MWKIAIFITLFCLYCGYSALVYTKGTENHVAAAGRPLADKGKQLFQQHNCISCHQVYGLGGYLGPDLTTAYSDKNRGPQYILALLRSGGSRMPDFHFNDAELKALLGYFRYIDATATSNNYAE